MIGGGKKTVILEDPRGYDPELEAAMKTYRPKVPWSDDDIAMLKRYYGKVNPVTLAGKLHRTRFSIDSYASRLGLTAKKGNNDPTNNNKVR